MKWDRMKQTFGHGRQVILLITKAGHAVPDADAAVQLQVEDVAPVEEEDHLPATPGSCPRAGSRAGPHELLVEARDRREEDDRVHVVEVGVPCRALCEDAVSGPGHTNKRYARMTWSRPHRT